MVCFASLYVWSLQLQVCICCAYGSVIFGHAVVEMMLLSVWGKGVPRVVCCDCVGWLGPLVYMDGLLCG